MNETVVPEDTEQTQEKASYSPPVLTPLGPWTIVTLAYSVGFNGVHEIFDPLRTSRDG